MPVHRSKVCLKPGITALLAALLLLYAGAVVSLSYDHYNYLNYYKLFTKIEPGMAKAEVHKLLKGWARSDWGEREAWRRGLGDVEEYTIHLQFEGGDFVRIYYEDSLVVKKEALSQDYPVFTEGEQAMYRSHGRAISWLTIVLIFGSTGIVSCPLFWKKRRLSASGREKAINGVLTGVSVILATTAGLFLLVISLVFSCYSLLLVLGPR